MYIHVQILGTYSAIFTYGWVQNGYLLGHNDDIFWCSTTNGSSNNSLISKNSFIFGYGRCARSPSTLCPTVVKVSYYVWPTI